MSDSSGPVTRFWVVSIVVGVVILVLGAVLLATNAALGWALILVGAIAAIGAVVQLMLARRPSR